MQSDNIKGKPDQAQVKNFLRKISSLKSGKSAISMRFLPKCFLPDFDRLTKIAVFPVYNYFCNLK